MELRNTFVIMVVCCWNSVAQAQLQLPAGQASQCVLSGAGKNVFVTFYNSDRQIFAGEIRARLVQTSSALAVKVGEVPWKKLQVLPGQTVLEFAQLDFPAVTAETKFLVQWVDNTNHVIGKTEILVYPTNLLAELKPLASNAVLGIFDPQNQIKPLLKNLKVEFSDLENSGLETFSGRLTIVGPFQSKVQMREGLAEQIQTLAKKGAAIVWLQPPRGHGEKLSPSFYLVPGNANATNATNAIVVVQPELVSNLAKNPQAQLNLIYFCKLALQPETFQLPNLNHNHD